MPPSLAQESSIKAIAPPANVSTMSEWSSPSVLSPWTKVPIVAETWVIGVPSMIQRAKAIP
jgi:hypothetical protein